MCLVKKPKIPSPSDTQGQQQKPLPILRNPILDGMLGDIGAVRSGTNAFRIDLINPLTIPGGPRGGARGGSVGASSGTASGAGGGSGGSGGGSIGGSFGTGGSGAPYIGRNSGGVQV